jgi:thiol-disulfide isomerase/thioredoxin
MGDAIDRDRRWFLGLAGLAIVAAHAGLYRVVNGSAGGSGDLAALGRATTWLNSPPLTPASLAGKVVLVNFCTYTCINWLRTLPYIRAWADKYRQHLVVVGVHTPEFGFERNVDHVRRALQQMRIEFPVAIDNEYAIWRAFDNNYWPALYFIDSRGRLRDHHFGEGGYERSERVIQGLVADAGAARVDQSLVSVEGAGVEAAADWKNLKSPETYLGTARAESFASPGGAKRDRRLVYAAPDRMSLNQWALAGEWTVGIEAAALSRPGGRILCRFHGRDLHLVMAPPREGPRVRFRVSIDGQPPGAARGADVDDEGNGVVVEPRLYQLVRQPKPIVDRRFEIEFLDAGVEALAFTFG